MPLDKIIHVIVMKQLQLQIICCVECRTEMIGRQKAVER